MNNKNNIKITINTNVFLFKKIKILTNDKKHWFTESARKAI